MTVDEFGEKLVEIAEGALCDEINPMFLAMLKTKIAVAVRKLYDSGGCVHDCYKQPIEKFEDVDILLHVTPINTVNINLARVQASEVMFPVCEQLRIDDEAAP